MSRLADQLQRQSGASLSERSDDFFERHGHTRNPFPPARTIWPEVLYNQDEAVDRFAQAAKAVVGSQVERRAVAILGGTGVGKTHFLRHARFFFERHCMVQGYRFAFVDFQAGAGRIQELVRSTHDALDQAFRTSGAADFPTVLVDALSNPPERVKILEAVQPAELRSALQVLAEARRASAAPGRYPFEVLREMFQRWLRGGTLGQTERKHLKIFGRLGTGTMAIRVLSEALALARKLDVLQGVLLCLDELEALFAAGLKPLQIQSFLQDLRYLFDESSNTKGAHVSGYSLLFMSASTPTGARYLQNVNQPLYQRLGFELQDRVTLRPITGPTDASRFAAEYVNFDRSRWNELNRSKDVTGFPPVLTVREVGDAYATAVGPRGPGEVSQAALLESLSRMVEEKRTGR